MAIGVVTTTVAPKARAATILRDGNPPAGMPGDSVRLSAPVRYDDRRSTVQVVVPPVIIAAGALSAIYGFLAVKIWPLAVGITAFVAGLALLSAFDRLKKVPMTE